MTWILNHPSNDRLRRKAEICSEVLLHEYITQDMKERPLDESFEKEASPDHDEWEDNGISVMKSIDVNFRTMVNPKKLDNSNFVLPFAVVQAVKHKFENSLVGFLVGKKVAFPLVKNYVMNTWAKFGFEKVMSNDDVIFYFKVSSLNGLDQVLEQGKDTVTKVPVWVKLHKVPVGRIGFARALIEVSAERELKQEIIMAILKGEDENVGHTLEKIRIESEWKPPLCLDCHVFGHTNDLCPKKVHEKRTPDVVVNKDGFTTVTNRKSKGKGALITQSKNYMGFKVHNPKNVECSRFDVWREQEFDFGINYKKYD
nr:hypothetical protein [Tanacetum cinerariifolium]